MEDWTREDRRRWQSNRDWDRERDRYGDREWNRRYGTDSGYRDRDWRRDERDEPGFTDRVREWWDRHVSDRDRDRDRERAEYRYDQDRNRDWENRRWESSRDRQYTAPYPEEGRHHPEEGRHRRGEDRWPAGPGDEWIDRRRAGLNRERQWSRDARINDFSAQSGSYAFGGMTGGYSGSLFRTEPSGRYTGRGPKNWQRSDERIREDVNEQLTRDPNVDASEIEVTVASCEVTLIGTVESRYEKRQAEDAAWQVSGVKDVHNQLRVKQSTGGIIDSTIRG